MKQPSIEELCKPLSAKVMPRSACYGIDHTPVSQEHAFATQRASVSNVVAGIIRRQDRKKKARK